MTRSLTLSVLDQSPVREGGTAADALRETVALAKAVEQFGYARFWVAEHHNTAMFSGTAPEILIGQIAAHTSRIRVGSGGVMLTHYSALKVAETFRVLAAFYPGRIDLGIGRAPGSDQRTAVALSAPRPLADVRLFPRQVDDVLGFLHDRLPQDHPYTAIEAQPGPLPDGLPDVWLLGSSDYSARLAATMGLPFAFADFFGAAGEIGPEIAELYMRHFQPSDFLQEPKLSVAVSVVCAESEERAEMLSSSMKVAVARMRTGAGRSPLMVPEEAYQYLLNEDTRPLIASFTSQYIVGTPDQVHGGLLAAADRYGTNDLILATNCFAFADRVRSYELVSLACGLPVHCGSVST